MDPLRVITSLYPKSPLKNRNVFAAQWHDVMGKYGLLLNERRLSYFLAQLGHESGGLLLRAENLNYSAARLRVVWPSRFRSLASAAAFAHQPEHLANRVYGGRMGNTEPGDGYRYRGRGYIQLTGRSAYRDVGAIIDMPLEEEPDQVLEIQHALLVACGFWTWKGLNALSDKGGYVAVTRRINGGTTGLADRQAWLQRVTARLAEETERSKKQNTLRPKPKIKPRGL